MFSTVVIPKDGPAKVYRESATTVHTSRVPRDEAEELKPTPDRDVFRQMEDGVWILFTADDRTCFGELPPRFR